MGIVDLSQFEEKHTFENDICVVGTGPGGASVAASLARKGYDVFVVETGNRDPDSDFYRYIAESENPEQIVPRFGFSRQYGGTSNLWAGRTAPFEDADFDPKSGDELSLWPITREELMPYYRQAAKILGIADPDFTAENPDLPQPPDTWKPLFGVWGLDVKRFQWSKTPFNTADYLSECMSVHPSLTVCMAAQVTHMLENVAKNRVEAACLVGVDGQTATVRAQVFVLAAGGIETPRILLNSTERRASGIGNDCHQVGRYLSTHPKMNAAKLCLDKSVSIKNPLYMDYAINKLILRDGIGLSSEVLSSTATLNHYVQLSPAIETLGIDRLDALNQRAGKKETLLSYLKFVRKLTIILGTRLFNLIGRVGVVQRRATCFTLRVFFDQYPNPDNRVTLSSELDSHGFRKARIEWEFTDRDRQSVIRFFEVLDRCFKEAGLGEIESNRLAAAREWELIGMHSHFMGTTRMGKDPHNSVTDENCRVHGMQNLLVSGPSLFPCYGYANPFYTIFALGLRIADYIDQKNLVK